MDSMNEAPRYQAYLLRLWLAGDDDTAVWRASLEDPRTGERRGFADVNSLLTFLSETYRQAD
jgi:hypothetical protein